jgi:hypothetical protein
MYLFSLITKLGFSGLKNDGARIILKISCQHKDIEHRTRKQKVPRDQFGRKVSNRITIWSEGLALKKTGRDGTEKTTYGCANIIARYWANERWKKMCSNI